MHGKNQLIFPQHFLSGDAMEGKPKAESKKPKAKLADVSSGCQMKASISLLDEPHNCSAKGRAWEQLLL